MATIKGLNFKVAASIGGMSALKSFEGAVSRIATAGQDAQSAFRNWNGMLTRLRDEFNPSASAAAQLKEKVDRLKLAMDLGVIGIEDYNSHLAILRSDLDKVRTAASQVTSATDDVVRADNRRVKSWNRGLGDTKRAIQQVGFQVGDFFTQVAGGQSIVLAFTQQAGQLVQFFGMWGSLAAAAIAIGGALWWMFRGNKSAVDAMKEAMDELNKSTDKFSSSAQESMQSLDELREKYGSMAEVARSALRDTAILDRVKATKDLAEATRIAATHFGNVLFLTEAGRDEMARMTIAANQLEGKVGFALSDIRAVQDEMSNSSAAAFVENLASSWHVSAQEAKIFANQIADIDLARMSGDVQAQANAAALLSQHMNDTWGSVEHMQPDLQIFAGELAQVVELSSKIQGSTELMSPVLADSASSSELLKQMMEKVAQYADRIKQSLSGVSFSGLLGMSGGGSSPVGGKPLSSFAGGGETGSGSRTGGVDGKGGFLAILHPNETVIDHMTRLNSHMAGRAGAPGQGIAGVITSIVGGGMVPAIEDATDATKELASVADTVAQSFMSAFSGIVKHTKSLKDGVMDMLNSIIDKTIELLMMPVFNHIAGGIAGGITGFVGGFGSFEGGGYTGTGSRSGGMDGRGGFLAMLHPQETVIDHRRSSGRSAGGVNITVNVNGATGNSEIRNMVNQGVSEGLRYYDSRVLPGSVQRVSANPRRVG